MAITFDLVKATPYTLTYSPFDDTGNSAANLSNAQMLSDVPRGPLRELLRRDVVGATQADARRALLGWGTGADPVTEDEPHAIAWITNNVTSAFNMTIDAVVDAVNAARFAYSVDNANGATSFVPVYLRIHFRHTYFR